jgi:hypothetical protein
MLHVARITPIPEALRKSSDQPQARAPSGPTTARRRSTKSGLVGVIVGLIGWSNESYIAAQWRSWSIEWPFVALNILPRVLMPAAEQALKPRETFRECVMEEVSDYC